MNTLIKNCLIPIISLNIYYLGYYSNQIKDIFNSN